MSDTPAPPPVTPERMREFAREFKTGRWGPYTDEDIARALLAGAEAMEQSAWQPIETAPKDRPIWVYYDHAANPYFAGEYRLTTYGAWAEGGSPRKGTGQCVAVWGGGYRNDESGEGWGPMTIMPDWWFEAGSDFEVAINPTHWMPLPAPPTTALPQGPHGDGA